jgi:hypothetical protein
MLNLYGGAGMGAAGTGMGAAGTVPQGGVNPQLLAMLMQGQQGGAQAPMIPPGGPMANYIGAGGNPAAMQRPMMPPVAAPPAPDGSGAGGTGAGGMSLGSPQMMQMLQLLKGGQTGLPAAAGGAGIPGQMAPGFGGGTGPLAPGIDSLLRSLGMFGGITGGAPT